MSKRERALQVVLVVFGLGTVVANVDPLMNYGDGTVPLVSAIPWEMSKQFLMPFHSELHASLQNNSRILAALKGWLRQSQVQGLNQLKEISSTDVSTDRRPTIRLSLADVYQQGERIEIAADVVGCPDLERVSATIYRVDRESRPVQKDLLFCNGRWALDEPELCEGCYRLRLRAIGRNPETQPMPVSDIFNIVASSELESVA